MTNDTQDQKFTSTLKSAVVTEVQNKEAAVQMGEANEGNPNILPGGLISKYGYTEAKAAYLKKKKQDKAFMDFLFREMVRECLIRINEIIAYQQKQIEELLQKIAESDKILQDLDCDHKVLETELEYFQKLGFFDLDEYWRLKNQQAEDIITMWENKAGQTIDRSNPSAYESILKILGSGLIKFDPKSYGGDFDHGHKIC